MSMNSGIAPMSTSRDITRGWTRGTAPGRATLADRRAPSHEMRTWGPRLTNHHVLSDLREIVKRMKRIVVRSF